MKQKSLAFTAVFLERNGEYLAFIEELPGMNSHGRTIGEARKALYELACDVFAEERCNVDGMPAGRNVLRESIVVPLS